MKNRYGNIIACVYNSTSRVHGVRVASFGPTVGPLDHSELLKHTFIIIQKEQL